MQFLYEYLQTPFSREQLLNAVWSMEEPTDRTVDDHIYRLRKKLKPLQEFYTLDTIRGFGYQLTSRTKTHTHAFDITMSLDPEFQQATSSLVSMYRLYGNGQAIETLLNDQNLGIQLPTEDIVNIHFMKGDFAFMANPHGAPFADRLMFLLYMLEILDGKDTVFYYEKAIQQNSFTQRTAYEARILLPLYLYLKSEEWTKLEAAIAIAEQEIKGADHGFYPFFHNFKLMYGMATGKDEYSKEQIEVLDAIFETRPYMREKGIYYILLGIFNLLKGEQKEGGKWLQDGFSIIKHSLFVSHFVFGLDLLRFFLRRGLNAPFWNQYLEKNMRQVKAEHDEEAMKADILKQLKANL
ncbi:hypothetical protein GCM10008968_10040 [Bacillus horti]